MAVFSSSTTIASILRPRTTDTAVSYFRWMGLHKSTIRPRTLEEEGWRLSIIAKRKGEKKGTWKYPLQTGQSLLKFRFSLWFVPFHTCLKELVINILKFLICFYVQLPEKNMDWKNTARQKKTTHVILAFSACWLSNSCRVFVNSVWRDVILCSSYKKASFLIWGSTAEKEKQEADLFSFSILMMELLSPSRFFLFKTLFFFG